MMFIKGIYSGLSVLAGSMAYWLPTVIFMWRAAAQAGAATRFVVVFFAGEAVKLFLCGVLFVLAVKYFNTQLLYTLIGLVSAIVAFWIASVVMVFQTRVKL